MKFLVPSSLFIAILIFSCQSDEEPIQVNAFYDNVDPALWDYWQAFETEAYLRGIDLDLKQFNLSGELVEIEDDHVAGTCSYGGSTGREIEIDIEIWSKLPSNYKEFIVFHELGHCVLNRGHSEAQDDQGLCLSIMRSGLGSCIDNYRSSTRNSYLDELFSNSY